MIRKLEYFLIIILFISCNNKNEKLKIIFTGDIILDRGVNDQLKLHGDSLLIKSFESFDKESYLVVNLEGTLTEKGTQQSDKYNFKSNTDKARILKESGVTHASVANNHSFDYGQTGFSNTVNALKANSITPIGNLNKPSIILKGNYKCAVLAVSLTSHNDHLPISSVDQLKESINSYFKTAEDIPLILYIHWGLELQPTPEKWQKQLAKDLIESGVDAIIGHHSHVTQTIQFINGKPVFFSLGNFIADAYLPETDKSFAVEISIQDEIVDINIKPFRLLRYFPKKVDSKEQIADLKHHCKYSDITLIKKVLLSLA